MKNFLRTLGPVLAGLYLIATGVPRSNAQIENDIRAHLDHSFVIGNSTLPPGDYTFHMSENTDLSVMTATSSNDKISVEFLVRETIANHTPAHSELVFHKYGNTEFLYKIFQTGSTTGAEVTETSRQESHFVKTHQHASEHSEVQK